MMNTFKYTLAHLPCKPISDDVVVFDAPRDYILLDSVVIDEPAVQPLNNLLLDSGNNQVMNLIPYVDLVNYRSTQGSNIQYPRFETADDGVYRVQYVVVLLIND